MQASETENKNILLKGDEERINFRPSPNFKHMRKYLKYKFDEMSGNQSGEESSTPDSEKNKMVQPPLPLQPPPPDSPILLKKEIEDDEYEMKSPEETVPEYKNEENKTMCRRFARGMCDKGAACIYAHEIILSQLPYVYTFCNRFQNRGCDLPKCKYVHATVFEKEHYFRTGYLPPHALVHLKKNNTPPLPAPIHEVPPAEAPQTFANPPPVMHSGGFPLPAVGCSAPPLNNIETLSTPPMKREWSNIEDLCSNNSRILDSIQSFGKKCKYCDFNEFRLQCKKNKVTKSMIAAEEMKKKIAQLSRKSDKVYIVLQSMLQTSNNSKGPNILNGLVNNHRTDNGQLISDQLNSIFTNNIRISPTGEDKNGTNGSQVGDLTSALMKLLLKARNGTLSDSS